jgi:tetratricopeptide (TPR) repeat protein
VGDRAGEGTAYGNLGFSYRSQGDFSQAIKYHAQDLAIAKEVGDRAGKGRAYGNLFTCHMHLNGILLRLLSCR